MNSTKVYYYYMSMINILNISVILVQYTAATTKTTVIPYCYYASYFPDELTLSGLPDGALCFAIIDCALF